MSLFIIALLLIIVVASLGSYVFVRSNIDTTITSAFLRCPVGYCATSLSTGVKRCSDTPNDRVVYDPSAEVCNPVSLCTFPQTPNAELGDGSTNSAGVCDSSISGSAQNPCRCLRFPKCASYISNHFEYSIVTSNDITDTDGSNINIVQGNVGTSSDGSNIFACAIPGASLANVIAAPNCSGIDASSPTALDQYITCIKTNACPDGVMATIVNGPQEVESFTMTGSNWNIANLSCVKGYDTDSSGVLLKSECIRAKPSQEWWNRTGHCPMSLYPTDQQWQSYLSGTIGSWTPQCVAAIEDIWNPVYDRSTHIMYCKNT